MRKSLSKLLLAALLLPAGTVSVAQGLNPYDSGQPFGWATCSSADAAGGFNITGGGKGSSITLTSNGGDMREAIRSAIRNHAVVILDGSNGPFIVSADGILISSDNMSKDKTIVGINGATICSQNTVTDGMRAALSERKSEIIKGQGAGKIKTRDFGELDITVSESDERHTREILIDYFHDKNEGWRNWGVMRINGGDKDCNVVIRNISFIGPGSVDLGGMDALSINGCRHVWIDHCHFQDGLDGNLDLSQGSDFITVSWCTFSYGPNSWSHKFSNLLYGSAEKQLHVTFAYCIWGAGIYSRTPMGGYSMAHMLNCFYDAPGSGDRVNPRAGGKYLLEGCFFAPGRNYLKDQGADGGAEGGICCRDNVFANGEKPVNSISLTVPYPYDVLPAELVPEALTGPGGAGPTLSDPLSF